MATIFLQSNSRVSNPIMVGSQPKACALSHDDDLASIIKSFAERTFADGALLTRQLADAEPLILTATGMLVGHDEAVAAQVRRIAILAAREDTRWFTGEPTLAWSECVIDGGTARVLSMPLPPEQGARITVCAMFAPRSPVIADAAEAVASRLHPMLASYFRLWSKYRAERTRSLGFEGALDVQGFGIAMIDGEGDLLFVNTLMERVLDAADGLRRHGDTLVATDLASAVRFQVAVAQVIGSEAGAMPSAGRPAPLVQLKRPRGAGMLLAALIPIERGHMEPRGATATINILDPNADGARTLKPVCALHGLSPVETTLVVHLVSGESVIDAAKWMRVKENTARAYLKQIFLKTETSRQSDLVRLMLTSAFRLHDSIIPVTI